MNHLQREFLRRTAGIPRHGIGLSVDVHSPDLRELHQSLEATGISPEYLEIFKAPTSELSRIREALPDIPLVYHAEGLWLVEPEMRTKYPWRETLETIARHTDTIGASWVNHECAAKQFGGISVGTYLPPVFTREAAETTAANTIAAQEELDAWYALQGKPQCSPLFLLELPPLTYFGFGNLSVSEFFRRIVEECPCGLVLDIGHLWTHWRYRERFRFPSLEAFTTDVLEHFPLERVVQIHLAGLGLSEGVLSPSGVLPWWVDAHASRVPAVLWELLRHVLAYPGLTSLKGIALEVDTKAIPLIVEEFGRLREEPECHRALSRHVGEDVSPSQRPVALKEQRLPQPGTIEGVVLTDIYRTYARVVSGEQPLEDSELALMAESLDREGLLQYITRYLPHELLRWGGDLEELFPVIWDRLNERGITLQDFVGFWFRKPCAATAPYDFFYIKLERWEAFVREMAPDLWMEVAGEVKTLRSVHADLNDEPTGAASR